MKKGKKSFGRYSNIKEKYWLLKKNKDPPYIEIEIFEKFSIFSTKMRVTNYISTHDNYEECKII